MKMTVFRVCAPLGAYYWVPPTTVLSRFCLLVVGLHDYQEAGLGVLPLLRLRSRSTRSFPRRQFVDTTR